MVKLDGGTSVKSSSKSVQPLVFAKKSKVTLDKIDSCDVTKYCSEGSFENVAKNTEVVIGKIDPGAITKHCNGETFENVAKSTLVSVGKIEPSDVTKFCNEETFKDVAKNSEVAIGKINPSDVTKYCNEDSFRKTSKSSVVEIEKMDVDDNSAEIECTQDKKEISDDVFCDDEKLKHGAQRKLKPNSTSLENTFKSLEGELYNSMNDAEEMCENKNQEINDEQNNYTKNKTKNYLQKVIDKLQQNDTLGIFAIPVSVELVPDYLEIIKKPMDFSTMRKKLENSEYETVDDVEVDFNQMINNCMIYNKKTTIFYKTAKKLKTVGDKIILDAKEKKQLKKKTRIKEIMNSKDLSTPTKEEMSGVDKLLKLMSKVKVVKNCEEPKISNNVTEKDKMLEKQDDVPMDSTKTKHSETTQAKDNLKCQLLNKQVKVNLSKISSDWSTEAGLPSGWQKRSKPSLETKKMEYFYKCPLGCVYKSTTEVETAAATDEDIVDEDIVEIPRYMAAFDQFVTKETKLSTSLKQNSCIKCQESVGKTDSLEKRTNPRTRRPGLGEKESCVEKQERAMVEELQTFFTKNNLQLKLREPTKADGNCFFRAMADQILLHSISSKPSTHHTLRHAVCSHLKHLPENVLNNIVDVIMKGDSQGLQKLSSRQRKPGEFVDDEGVMLTATALFLNRNIEVYSANQDTYAKAHVQGGEGAQDHPALTVFYYKDFQHYQSISKID